MNDTACYITTPIYYVNGTPHIGHAYTTVLADCITRYHRLFGDQALLSTGTDEHGQKVQEAARRAGISPHAHAGQTAGAFRELWHALAIDYDAFVRTTQPSHTRAVTAALTTLYTNGEIYKGLYEGWYCVPCERFWPEADLADGACPDCLRVVERYAEPAWFFRQSAYQQWLVDYITAHPRFIQPETRRSETRGFLKKPLADLCISRPVSRLSWGIPLPFDRDFVCYVWFDALLNYLSVLGYPDHTPRLERFWPATLQLIGKDILTTHTVYWPIILHALGFEPPRTIFAHGWWLNGERKVGKSTGTAIDPWHFIHEYGADALRWFLIAEPAHGADCPFTRERFAARYRSDLAGGIGSLASRVFALAHRFCSGLVPESGNEGPSCELRDQVLTACESIPSLVDSARLDAVGRNLLDTVSACNRFLQQRAPWTITDDLERNGIIFTALETLRAITVLFEPVAPHAGANLRHAFGTAWPKTDPWPVAWGLLHPGQGLHEPGQLFPRKDH